MIPLLKITAVSLVLAMLSGCAGYSVTGYSYPYAYAGPGYYPAYYPGAYGVGYARFYGDGWHDRDGHRGDERHAAFHDNFATGRSGGALQARGIGHNAGGGAHSGHHG
jgi:hypothetical protein